MNSRATTTFAREEGNTLVLSIVLSAVAIAMVLTFATITQLHIERKRLLALADSAALHAATAIDERAYFLTPGTDVPLTDETVRRAVDEHIARLPTPHRARFHHLTVGSSSGVLDGHTAQVTLAAFVRPGYIPWSVVPFDGIHIEVTSAARAD